MVNGLTEEESNDTWRRQFGVDVPRRRPSLGSGDLTGYGVEATDGSIGKIDEASHTAGEAFLVVDTGFWIFGKKRLIPAGVVQRIDDTDRKVYVRMTKDQIKSAPDFEEKQRTYRDDLDDYYGTYYQ